MSGWVSEERYFDTCPMCGEKLPMREMVLLKKADTWNCKKLTRLCKNDYIKILEYIGISDVEL